MSDIIHIQNLAPDNTYLMRFGKRDLTGVCLVVVQKDNTEVKFRMTSTTIQGLREVEFGEIKELYDRYKELEFVKLDNAYIDMLNASYKNSYEWMRDLLV